MRRVASLESEQQLPDEGANESRSPSDPARVVDASSPDAPKALKVRAMHLKCPADFGVLVSWQPLPG